MTEKGDEGTLRRPQILFLASDPGGIGGIGRYGLWLIDALEQVGAVETVDLAPDIQQGGMGRARALARAATAWARTRPDLVVLGHVSFGPAAVPQVLARRPSVVLAYGIDVWGPPSERVDLALRAATEVWPISTFTSHEVARRVPAARVGPVLGGGITDEFFSSSRALGPSAPAGRTEAPGPLRVLVVTRLDDLTYKGIDTCLDAIARSTADVELRIAGDGPAASALSTLVSTRRLERSVRQLGRVDDRVLRDEYARADVAVLLSRFRRGAAPMGEGLGIVPLEAGAAGTPAIVSSVGGTVDTVVDGVTGWLVDPDDVEGLAGLFEQLGLDRSIGMHRGEEARRFVRRVHSREAFRRRVGRAVEGVLGRSCAA